MPKRTSDAAELPVAKAGATGQATARPDAVEDEEMGEFEDRWEDEVESEEEVVANGANDNEDGEDGELISC
jgi:ribosome assembly protein RRB1